MNSRKRRYNRNKKRKVLYWLGIVFGLVIIMGAFGLFKIYVDTKSAIQSTYKKVDYNNIRKGEKAEVNKGNPISLLILGVDTGEYGRTYRGRSDTIMIAAISEKKASLVSIPRDTKVSIAGHGSENKINAAYAYGGISGAINTMQNYLDIPIDHYIRINMKGLIELSKAVGPIYVENNLDFSHLGHHYSKGKIKLDSSNILPYTQMRYNDPHGDYGRQLRQREVIIALVNKLVSINSLTTYKKILSAVSNNMTTDLTFSDMKSFITKYKGAENNIQQIQLKGNSKQINGVSYEVVPQDNLENVKLKLKKVLDIN